jgi:molybdenum cofactor cytidylyltransferase
MIFDEIPTAEAAGAILVHSTRCGDRTLKKGLHLTAEHVASLMASDVANITVARLEPGDVHEDEAARLLADALAGENLAVKAPFTGRANLHAGLDGLASLDIHAIDAVNMVDEAVTVATVPSFERVTSSQMVATVKIIPFAVPRETLDLCLAAASTSNGAIGVAGFRDHRVALILTRTAAIKDRVLDKTADVVKTRLASLGMHLSRQERVSHRGQELAQAIKTLATDHDLVLVYGASAITDRRDVVPAAIEQAGGCVDHLGMPVDPGNLLLLGHLDDTTVLGLPGCARSPKLNGFDWVLQRLAAGLQVTGRDIMAMGVGGLLKEIPLRPRPREQTEDDLDRADRRAGVAALVLAAGQSRRMGNANKLLIPLDGKPMVRHIVDALTGSGIETVHVVIGHEAEAIQKVLTGYNVSFTPNPHFDEGLSTSLQAGLAALPDDIDAVLVCLGDMPGIRATDIEAIIRAYDPSEGHAIVVPTHQGKRGNPVLWDRRFFEAMTSISGDTGARHLIGENEELVLEVNMDDSAVLEDFDNPESLTSRQS